MESNTKMMQENSFKQKIINKLKLISAPHIKLYEGFGNHSHCNIMGHALQQSPRDRETYKDGMLHNSIHLLRLFMVKPLAGATIQVHWQGKDYETTSEHDGFFKFELPNDQKFSIGKHTVIAKLRGANTGEYFAEATAHITIPETNQFTFISDIDDTFLISHSATILKRLRVLLTRNAHSRKPFEGVVSHYNALQYAQTTIEKPNPFFYVSSSEWNLYRFINTFIEKNNLPDGVSLLNQIKTLSQVFKTGKNNHNSKFTRIVRILEAYPTQRFILLGDDSQRDAYIYSAVAEHFPHLVHCVYIRSVKQRLKPEVEAELKKITDKNIAACYFLNSVDAFEHSKKIGLINV